MLALYKVTRAPDGSGRWRRWGGLLMFAGRIFARRAARLGVALLGLAAVTAVSAHAEDTLERAKKDGYIRVGFANEAPFAYATPDGKLTGEAPEVAKVILK